MCFLNGETTKLNKKYYNGKAVAYMQDTEAWSIYKDSQGYAGYQISWDGGTTWKTLTDNSAGYLSTDTFRPIVCLSSKVTLELNEVSQKYEIKQ